MDKSRESESERENENGFSSFASLFFAITFSLLHFLDVAVFVNVAFIYIYICTGN